MSTITYNHTPISLKEITGGIERFSESREKRPTQMKAIAGLSSSAEGLFEIVAKISRAGSFHIDQSTEEHIRTELKKLSDNDEITKILEPAEKEVLFDGFDSVNAALDEKDNFPGIELVRVINRYASELEKLANKYTYILRENNLEGIGIKTTRTEEPRKSKQASIKKLRELQRVNGRILAEEAQEPTRTRRQRPTRGVARTAA